MNSPKEYYLEIFPVTKDFKGEEVLQDLHDLGIEDIQEVLTSKVYILQGSLANKDIERIAKELLTDPVHEKFTIGERREKGIRITVFFKPGVLDLESKRVLEALKIMGIEGIISVKTVRCYIIRSAAQLSVDACRNFSEKLLYNKVIEEAEIKEV